MFFDRRIYWISSGSFILNQVSEYVLDSKMERTKNRPIPQGFISPKKAAGLGWASISIGLILLAYVNILSVLLASITLVLYNFFYTLRWKQKYPYGAVFFGAIPGAMPVVLGYTANTSSILSIECGYLFLIMFLWQIPHFWSLAFHYKKDYTQAKIPVLPAYFGENKTFFHIGLYTLSYVGLALLAPLFLHTGFIYLIISLPIGLKILFEYYYFYKQKNWLPFFSWLNISLLVFLFVPFLDQKITSFYLSFLTKKATGQIIMNKPRLAFLCSGEGTTFEYLAQQTQFHPVCLITNIKKAPALKKAQNLNIPSLVICPSQYSSIDLWDQAVLKCLENKTIDLVILAGFLRRIGPQVLSHFKNKVINSHPSLLP